MSDLGGSPTWRNDDDGYEAEVWDMHRSSRVQFRPFVALTPELFGKAPGPVGELAKIKFGMTWDQVKATVPGLEGPKGGNGGFVPFQAKANGVTLEVSYTDDKVDRMSMRIPARGVAMMAKAWGPGQMGKERGSTDRAMQCWDTADKTMRVEAPIPSGDDTVDVSFVPPGHGFCELRYP